LNTTAHNYASCNELEKSWLCIVNPNAGNRKCEKDWPLIRSLIEGSGMESCFVYTKGRDDASQLARDGLGKGYKKFAVIGGDGTLNEVINGLLSSEEIPENIMVGMVPVGTGNDWCRMFNIPFDYASAIQTLIEEKVFKQDIGKVSYHNNEDEKTRYFINVAGMGYDAVVASKTNKDKEKGKGTKLSYMLNIFTCLFSYKTLSANITVDDNCFNRKVFSMNVGVCRYNGGGMLQVPDAIPDDGLLDLTIIKKISRWKVVINTRRLYDGSIGSLSFVELRKASNIKVDAGKLMTLEVDGESLGNDPFQFTIIPSAISVIVNKEYKL